MRYLGTLLLVIGLSTLVPARADALTIKEIMDLTRAGVSEEVLLALIEIDQRVFPVDAETLAALKKAGVTDRVMMAVVKSGRIPAPQPELVPPAMNVENDPPPPPEPQVVYVERERPVIREVAVAVPVYVAVPVVTHRTSRTHKAAEPVYWGWGGKLRPDAWKPSPDSTRDSTRPHDSTRPQN